jgi:hypothetical protein
MTHKTHTATKTKSKKAASQAKPAHEPTEGREAAAQEHATDPFHAALVELEGVRDDVRVRIHLAGMELKNVWNDLDKRYLALRDVAMHAKDDALTKARNGLMEVRKELHDLRGRLDRITSHGSTRDEKMH